MFPILETLYHGFTELRNRHNGANIQLNIELIRESCSGLSFIMNRNRSIQSGCSIINLAQNGAELSKDISKGSI